MRAKVINYPAGSVMAFGGIEFVGYEWRDVPAGFEADAERHPYLEIEAVAVEVEPEAVPEPPRPKRKPAARRTRRKAAPKGTK